MTDDPDDPAPPTGYPPPQFAPAAPQPAPAETTSPALPSEPDGYPPPQFAPAESSAPPADEPLLPAAYSERDLRAAIGSPPMPEQIRPRRPPPPDEDDDEGRPRRRRTVLVIAASLFAGLSIAVLVILGHLSAARYVVSCEAKQVVAEQGRAFPPWGTSRLSGDEWKPIKIPPSFPCVDVETEDLAELGDAYRKLLVDRAEAMLTAREVVQLEDVAGMLEQAMLHARGDSDAHKAARQHIQRLLGDVGYWRASAKLQEATKALTDAAKEFEAAAAQLPRHVSDASAWATYTRKLIDELRAGPAGARPLAVAPAPAPSPDRPAAPPGVALPVEPAAAAGTGTATSTSGAGRGSADAPPPPQPDAGIPTGGVLL